MKGIYLGAYKAFHPLYDIDYQDINGLRDIGGDMMNVDLSGYDFVIATPPCNFWSRANWHPSQYSFDTQHLLPDILDKLENLGKPYIVENVRNNSKFSEYGLIPRKRSFVFYIGRHTYWTNVNFNTFVYQRNENIQYLDSRHRQGSENVHFVIESWLKEIHNKKEGYYYDI